MNKAYSRIVWENLPSTNTALDADNLNRMDSALDTVDDRVVGFDTTKANQSDLLLDLKDVTIDRSTGTFTFTRQNGTTVTIDTDIEKIAVNFDYDDDPTSAHYQCLVLTLSDGTVKYIDMSALITQYEFADSTTIHFTLSNVGGVQASVIDGSITENKLQPNFLADCRSARTGAETAESKAETAEENAEAWAVGERGGVPVQAGDDTYHNNSKYYADQSSDILDTVRQYANETVFSVDFTTGHLMYTEGAYDFNINSNGHLIWSVV